jgi:Winged helix-turn helix
VPSSAAPGLVTCWRSTASWWVRWAETRRRWRPSCVVHAPVCTALSVRIAPGASAAGLTKRGQRSSAVPSTLFMPWLTRALGTILTKAPRVYGWGRPRWRWATLAATLQATHGIEVAADTRRRWLHERGWVWKRAKRVAKDDDPQRIER